MSEQFMILDAIGQIDDAYLEQYFVMKQALAKKHRSRVLARRWIALCAACLSMVVLAAFAGATLRGHFSPPVYLENGKLDISSLPGAQVVQKVPEVSYEMNGDIYTPDEFVTNIKESANTVVYGTVQNLKTVRVDEGWGYSWYIRTFEIQIIEEIRNCPGTQVISVVTAVRYYKDAPVFICGLSSEFDFAEQATGLFILSENSDDEWKINGTELKGSDLADYYSTSQFKSDGEIFEYYGGDIDLDELRGE